MTFFIAEFYIYAFAETPNLQDAHIALVDIASHSFSNTVFVLICTSSHYKMFLMSRMNYKAVARETAKFHLWKCGSYILQCSKESIDVLCTFSLSSCF